MLSTVPLVVFTTLATLLTRFRTTPCLEPISYLLVLVKKFTTSFGTRFMVPIMLPMLSTVVDITLENLPVNVDVVP